MQSQLKQALDAALAEARKVARPGQVDVQHRQLLALSALCAARAGTTRLAGHGRTARRGPRHRQHLTRLAGRIQTLSVARVGYSLSREAREKVEGEVSAQAIARFRSQAEAYAKAFGFGGVTLREVEVSTNESSAPPMPMFRAAAPTWPMAARSRCRSKPARPASAPPSAAACR